ncbi:enoyl-CoA hydratase/isomerase family protein [Notoacmeibacter sp. MSK16QG-6]|uniref:enoyl-CoA hydratase/isomerase family protein n=1 Tax=Notoacmeibacter sp. MSK16QG-6 TaxID=2957982 RepID=UPI0020A20E9C|nr:enoyl-CoA hydratase-related protein [Notoacmeibacter sp. MSK16QG-6]MCP1197866.1 enoyl-CoA hydratase-related protein [Notoacmeibacter sp. MSK16QG-6]
MTAIACHTENHVATITIDRPAKRNALTQDMWEELSAKINSLGESGVTRALILTGEGAHFCAGADIAEFESTRRDAASARRYEASNISAFSALRNAPFPAIAAISGVCFGGGFGLAAACDLRLADTTAKFCIPAARLGLAYPREAMIDIVTALDPQTARRLAFTADILSVEEALSAGFVVSVETDRPVLDAACALAGRIARRAPLSVTASKAAILATIDSGQPLAKKARAFGDATFDSDDYAEGRAAFGEKRDPVFKGR